MNNKLADINIEKLILNTFIENNFLENIQKYITYLNKEDFYSLSNQRIFSVIQKLYLEENPIEENIILNQLNNSQEDEKNLLDILSITPVTNIDKYIQILKTDSIKRKLLKFSNDINTLIYDENNNNEEILLSNLDEIYYNSIQKKEAFTKIKNSSQLIDSLANTVNKIKEEKFFVKSGIYELDNVIQGFEPGDLVIIAGRPGMGKSAKLATLANNYLNEGRGVLIYSLEMTAEATLRRIIAAKTAENITDIKNGNLKNPKKFNEALEYIRNSELHINDTTNPNINQLVLELRKFLSKNENVRDIFIDHIGKIKLKGKSREDIEIGEISRECKNLAKEFNARFYLLHQLNRKVEDREDKRPMLSDLKNSGNLEEDADKVLLLYNAAYYSNKTEQTIVDTEINIAKNRDGQTKKIQILFDKSISKMYSNQTQKNKWTKFKS